MVVGRARPAAVARSALWSWVGAGDTGSRMAGPGRWSGSGLTTRHGRRDMDDPIRPWLPGSDRRISDSRARRMKISGMPKRNGPGIELLADPTRRRIIAILAIRPWRPAALARAIGLSRPATTRQLRLLRGAGLLRASYSMLDGRAIVYQIDPDRHGQITAWLAGSEIGRPRTRGSPIAERSGGAGPTVDSRCEAHQARLTGSIFSARAAMSVPRRSESAVDPRRRCRPRRSRSFLVDRRVDQGGSAWSKSS